MLKGLFSGKRLLGHLLLQLHKDDEGSNLVNTQDFGFEFRNPDSRFWGFRVT